MVRGMGAGLGMERDKRKAERDMRMSGNLKLPGLGWGLGCRGWR